MPRCRSIGLYRETCRHRVVAGVVASMERAFARGPDGGSCFGCRGGRVMAMKRREARPDARVGGDENVGPDRAASGEREKARILVVDDDVNNLLAITNVLEGIAEVVVAKSGEEALRHLHKGDFAVILLGVYMPGMDGNEAARLNRGREQAKRNPVNFLT